MTFVQKKQVVHRVLVTGIYLADKKNAASQITREFAGSANWKVEQRWVSLGKSQPSTDLAPFTVQVTESPSPKFLLLNQALLGVDLNAFEYVIVSDDDIRLPTGFLDRYLSVVSRYGFDVAQPARTHESYIDHRFVEQLDGIDARRTRFVEIGPMFSLHRSAYDYFLPFDETSPGASILHGRYRRRSIALKWELSTVYLLLTTCVNRSRIMTTGPASRQ
jgi:hypothetical protein